MPVITLEVLSDSSHEHTEHVQEPYAEIYPVSYVHSTPDSNTGLHFLSEKSDEANKTDDKDESKDSPKARSDLLEYMMRNDGSVVCKLCGEILQSRTHWYRHKYKLHVIHPLHPAPLFQCEQCLVYFKSRKGYIGHLASRHSEVLSDSNPILTNSQAEDNAKETTTQATQVSPEEQNQPDPEMSIPKTAVPNYQATVLKQAPARTAEAKRATRGSRDANPADWEEKRSREEKLVADIIDRVRRECEAQGSGGPARRGYSRRYTVMHT